MAANNIEQNNPEGPGGLGVTRKQAYLIFAVIAFAFFMTSVNSSIVIVSLPAIMNDLQTNLAYVGWIVTGYQFSQSIAMPVAGKLSDEWGRKRVFIMAVIIFTASSLAAGFASNIYWLIFFRVLQGLGGGSLMPIGTGLISETFGKHRSTAIGLFSSIMPIGGVIGPNLGGFLIDNFTWRWMFLINIPIGLALIFLIIFIVPRNTTAPSHRRIDTAGAGLFAGAILSVLYAMTNWANNPDNPGTMTWAFFVLGAVFIYFFIRQENKAKQPMIEIHLLRWRPFLAANTYNFIFGAVVLGFFTFIPYYAMVAYGMSASESGIILTPRSLASMIFSTLSSLLLIRFGYRSPMVIGLVIMSAGLLLLSQGYSDINVLGVGLHNMILLTLIVMMGGVGMGVSNPAANNAVLDLFPEKVAAVAGMRGMFRVMGGIMGTSGVIVILSHFPDKAVGLETIALGFSALLILTIPVVFLIPDTARQRRAVVNSTE